ncbi:MAG: hypothetical protein K0R71_1616 [Bacillales bacterium]|jgi:hypothetical protein|nr:hypothetical protein [Bacillales bacterium]
MKMRKITEIREEVEILKSFWVSLVSAEMKGKVFDTYNSKFWISMCEIY